ncbi:unnamed protein product, partial [Gulo gulo]
NYHLYLWIFNTLKVSFPSGCFCFVFHEKGRFNCPTECMDTRIIIRKPGYCHEYFHILMKSTNKE